MLVIDDFCGKPKNLPFKFYLENLFLVFNFFVICHHLATMEESLKENRFKEFAFYTQQLPYTNKKKKEIQETYTSTRHLAAEVEVASLM